MQHLGATLDAQAGGAPATIPLMELLALVDESGRRDAPLTGLLDDAVGEARALAASDRAMAQERRNHALEAGLGFLVVSLLAALWLGRRVSGALCRVAVQADRITEGSLVDVPVAGPREVRRVSAALGSAVAGLRRIQAQAEAVAQGDLSDPVLHEPLPGRLGEVTETVLVDTPSALANLAALRELGASVAIDDFGTGYTSIGQLRHMPVDTLKIDRSFIASTDPGHRELVALIIRAAHTFGLTVVAEGVEEPAQLEQLRADACDHAQGYLLYRPLPADDAGALLRPVAVGGLEAPAR